MDPLSLMWAREYAKRPLRRSYTSEAIESSALYNTWVFLGQSMWTWHVITKTEGNNQTRDLAPKANVLRCRHRHTPRQARGWLVVHHGGQHVSGGGTLVGGWHVSGGWYFTWGVAYPWEVFHFGPCLVDGQWGEGKPPKVLLLAIPLELQYYFAPFSKAARSIK